MKKLSTLVRLVLISCSLMLVAPSYAQMQPTAEQLEQFKKLPRAQQELLARQYGFDLKLLSGGSGASSERDSAQTQQLIYPRGTRFDEQGQPLPPQDIEAIFKANDPEQPFGYKLFAGMPSTQQVTSNMAVPADYRLGPGDTLVVTFYGKESERYDVEVDRSGQIIIANMQPLQVLGMSFAQVQELIKNQVQQQLIGVQAAVSMSQLRSMHIYVTGEAYKPGTYTVNSLTTAMQALFLSGGVTDIASLRNVQVKRAGNVVSELDLYQFLIHGDASGDVVLQAGDVVFIPSRNNLVKISGKVLRPGLYELKNEKNLTEVMQLAGGKLAQGYADAIQVERFAGGKKVNQTIEWQVADNFVVQNGDHIQVQEVSGIVRDSIMLVGAVARPGYYQWFDGITVVDVLKNRDSSVLPITDVNYSLVIRSDDSNQNLSLYQFNLAKAFAGSSEDNFQLEKNDTILVFSSYEDAAEEALQLTNFIDSNEDRLQKERDALVAEYQRNYLRNLVKSSKSDEPASAANARGQDQQRTQANAPVDEQAFIIALHQRLLADFTTSVDQAPSYKTYSRFSRTMLLGPLYSRMQYQAQRLSEYPLVLVSGEVRFPGLYPRTENATVASLIAAAGGLKESAFLQRAEITRTEQKNGQLVSDYFSINLAEALAGKHVPLKGRDSLHVLTIPEWNTTVRVTLEGEVRFPGTYTVRRGETLSALVQRAGGLTEYAFANGAVFTRTELQKLESERMLQLAQDLRREMSSSMITGSGNSTSVSYSELNQLLSDLTNVTPVGRLVIDLPYILSGSTGADVQLKDGDRLVVPSQRNTVNVIGEVQLASAHIYDGSLSAQDYLRRAGGLRKKADDERIFIVKANGGVEMMANTSWFGFGNSQQRLEPGDTIVVPLDTKFKDNMTLWRDATQILYQTGVALAAVATL